MLVRLSTYARGTTYVCVCTVSKTARVRYLEWRVCGTTYVRVVSSIARVVSRIARAVLALRGRYLESCACAVSRSCACTVSRIVCVYGVQIVCGINVRGRFPDPVGQDRRRYGVENPHSRKFFSGMAYRHKASHSKGLGQVCGISTAVRKKCAEFRQSAYIIEDAPVCWRPI